LSEAASDSSTQSSTSGDKLSSDDKTQSTTTTKSQIDNQKICLVSSLIEIGDYKTALRIIEKLPQWYLAIDVEICMSICHSINKNFVDNMYKKYNLLSKYLQDKSLSTNGYKFDDRQKEDNDDEFTKSQIDCTNILESYNELLMPILCAIGPGLAYDPILFTKIIRIYAAFLDLKKFTLISSACSATSAGANNGLENGNGMKESSPPPSLDAPIEMNHQEEKLTADQILKTLNDTELIFYNQIYLCLNDVLLPSLSMLSMNPCLAIELWNLLKLFPYEMRYNLYNYWRQFTYKLFPSLIRARAESQEKIKYLLK
jgi:THO complex subunit 2